jgi:hypothetical protein
LFERVLHFDLAQNGRRQVFLPQSQNLLEIIERQIVKEKWNLKIFLEDDSWQLGQQDQALVQLQESHL